MKIITNDALIERNARIGRYAGIAGLLVLAAGAYISFTNPENVFWAWGALLVGFALAQLGIYYGNRWGRRPRLYELLSRELKGLDQSYSLYHFMTPVSHLLVGPSGVWALFPFYQRGRITYENGKWHQKGGGLTLAYLKLFAQEGIGRIDLQIQGELEALERYFKSKMPNNDMGFEIQAALIFTNERVVTEAEDAPYPTIPLKKLKDLMKKAAKTTSLSLPKAKAIQDAIEYTTA